MLFFGRFFFRLIFGSRHYKRRPVTRHTRRRAKTLVTYRAPSRRVAIIAQATAEHRGYASATAFARAMSLDTIYRRDRGRCGICGGKVKRDDTGPMRPSIDHVKALAKGGAHAPENVQLAHLRCNLRKGTKRR